MNRKEKLLKMINRWMHYNRKMQEVNKYLFEHTELYENRYENEFQDDLFRFFAGKITRFAKDENEIYKRLTNEQARELNEIKLMEEY